jgi:hypothetical protein
MSLHPGSWIKLQNMRNRNENDRVERRTAAEEEEERKRKETGN